MTTAIGRVLIDVAANAAGFERDIKTIEKSARREFRKVSRELRFAQRDLDQARAKVRNLGLAIGALGAASVVGVTRAFKSLADEADRIQKLATATGLTAESVQTLGFAAEQSGSDLETIAKGIQQLQRNVQGASDGLSTYTRAFERVGLEVEQLIGLAPERQFKLVAQAISEVEDPTTRTATALEVFGRAGRELLPLLQAGADGIEELERQVLATGGVLDSDATEAAERFNDALNVLRNQVRSVGVAIFSDLIEPIADYSEILTGTEQGQEVLRAALDDIGRAAKTVGTIIGVGLVLAFVKAIAQMLIAEVRVGTLTARMIALTGASGRAAGAIGFVGRAASILTGPIGIAVAAIGTLIFAFRDTASEVTGLTEDIDALIGNMDRVSARRIKAAMDEVQQAISDTADEIAELERQRRLAEEPPMFQGSRLLGGATFTFTEEDERRLELARERSEELTAQLAELGVKLSQVGQEARPAASSIGQLGEDSNEADREARRLADAIASLVREVENLEAAQSGPAAQAALEFNRQQAEVRALLEQGAIGFDLYSRAVRAYAASVVEALDPSEEIAEELARQAEIQQEAEDQYLSTRDALQQQITALSLTGDELRAFERAAFQAALVQELGENATKEWREEIARLAGELFDGRNAAITFAERVSDALNDFLPDQLAEGIGRGLEEGLTRGIASINTQDVLDGNFADIGNQLGQTLATSAGRGIGLALSGGSPIGGEIGALIGDIIGDALFGGSVPKFQVRGRNATRAIDEGTDLSVDGPLAQIDFAFREIEAETRAAVQRAFIQFDTSIASFITDTDQLTAIEAALDAFGVSSRSDGEDLEGLLQLRFDAILSTFDASTQDLVRAAAQTLDGQVQALADLQQIAIEEALGRGLNLDNLNAILAETQIPGEQLATTFARLRDAAALLDDTMALTGATFGATREDVLRFGADFAAAFGGDLQRASSLLSTIFGTFFDETERLEVQVEQSTARAVDLLASLGIDATDELLTRGGFRELFDSLAGTLNPADFAILVEAGAEIAALIGAEQDLAEARGEVVDATEDAAARQVEIAEFLRQVGEEALSVVAPARAEYAELAAQLRETEARARELGLSEEQLRIVRLSAEVQLRGFIAGLTESIASLSEQLFGAGPRIEALGSTLNVAANAAGNFRDQWLAAIDAIGDALNSQSLGPNSTLTAAERQAESVRQFNEALAAAQSGDLSAAQSLPQLFQQALAQGASFFGATTDDFDNLEAQLRSALESADLPVPPASPDVQTATNTAATAASAQEIALTGFEQLQAATQLIDQIDLLARLTGDTPAAIGQEFGIPIAELIGILTGEVPNLTGAALDSSFNDLAASIGEDLNELAQLEAIETQSRDLLQNILNVLRGGEMQPPGFAGPAPDPGFASGGIAGLRGPQRILVGEEGPEAVFPASVTSFLQRVGIPINSGSSSGTQQRLLAATETTNVLLDTLVRDQRTVGQGTRDELRRVSDELRKKSTAGKPALTSAAG